MNTTYNNVTEAFASLMQQLSNAPAFRNYSARSVKKSRMMHELRGVSFSIKTSEDWDSVVKEIDEKSEERIQWLKRLGEQFVHPLYIPLEPGQHYSYNSRIYPQKALIENDIKNNIGKNGRQSFLSIWDSWEDPFVLGQKEVPCSIGYLFFERNGELEMEYFMRSLDIKIWPNDVYLSSVVHKSVCKATGLEIGKKTFLVGSFHMFEE